MPPATRERTMGRRGTRSDGGQVLVVFALSLVILVSMAGLAVDVGGTFAQRRDQQIAADLAALAAANDYLINNDATLATARARAVATENGFTDGANGAAVTVAIDTSNGVEITVGVTAPHSNSFLGAIGMSSFTVSTQASALAGFPDTATGAGPFIFSISAFEDDGTPKYQTDTDFNEVGEPDDPNPERANYDVPKGPRDLAWTNYRGEDVNASEVSDIITGGLEVDRELEYGQYIGQKNNGNMTSIYGDVDTYLSGLDLPVAVVDNNGNFMGWAMFHVTSASGGSTKYVRGYFLSSFITGRLRVSSCAANDCPRYLGSYVLRLSD